MRDGLRALSVTFTGIMAGLAASTDTPLTALAALPFLLALAVQDAYLWSLYTRARNLVVGAERILASYADYLTATGPIRGELQKRYIRQLKLHQIGVNRTLRTPKLRDLRNGLWRPPYLYVLLGVSLLALFAFMLSSDAFVGDSNPENGCPPTSIEADCPSPEAPAPTSDHMWRVVTAGNHRPDHSGSLGVPVSISRSVPTDTMQT